MPRAKRSRKPSSQGFVVDFTGVEIGQRGVRLPEGDYRVKVIGVDQREAESSGAEYLNFKLEIRTKGEGKGKTVYHTCSLQPQALFNLRSTLAALGLEVPQKRIRIKPAILVGKEMMVTLADDEYQGRIRSRVVDTFPIGGRPEETPAKGKAKKAKAKDKEEDEEEEDEEEEDEDEEDEDEDEDEEEDEDLEDL